MLVSIQSMYYLDSRQKSKDFVSRYVRQPRYVHIYSLYLDRLATLAVRAYSECSNWSLFLAPISFTLQTILPSARRCAFPTPEKKEKSGWHRGRVDRVIFSHTIIQIDTRLGAAFVQNQIHRISRLCSLSRSRYVNIDQMQIYVVYMYARPMLNAFR